MGMINGLKTANGGEVRQFIYNKHAYLVEVMGSGVSGHTSNIVATYFIDDCVKTSLILWKKPNGEPSLCIFKYKRADITKHYYSKEYTARTLPSKYNKYARELAFAYNVQFNRREF